MRKRGGRKRVLGSRTSILVPERPGERWSLNVVSAAVTDGRRFRVLAIMDDFSRGCLAPVADTSLSGLRVTRELPAIMAQRGRPETIVSDNCTELTSIAVLRWCQETGFDWHYIAPGKPAQNAFVEPFNSSFPDENRNDTLSRRWPTPTRGSLPGRRATTAADVTHPAAIPRRRNLQPNPDGEPRAPRNRQARQDQPVKRQIGDCLAHPFPLSADVSVRSIGLCPFHRNSSCNRNRSVPPHRSAGSHQDVM
ncbi:DDE-type integrase/transposase/recombinase [Roseobacter sp. YSTF-M11]|uniref:DDE-type integrase/transposase/recombinase n=1 Tax=Roseobacter insulae TaxID=2859783 RepID=A0A9X1JXU8_9RHOB|nr:DDE-type integrase/transposase/recombinase [Roseobacter insulae]